MIILSFLTFQFSHCTSSDSPAAEKDVQGYSLSGQVLISAPAGEGSLNNLSLAKNSYESEPRDADAIIWYGRRLAYTGDYLAAIAVYSDGIALHPLDARMYRHRGHRYISIREFDRAIEDFETAATLIQGQENEIEADGLPNPLNIPLTTTHGNIWYHLGLAYYLKQDWPKALEAFQSGYAIGGNDDNLVSTGHWIYMTHRRMRRPEAAAAALSDISRNMTIIENMSYHELCLLYRKEISIDEMMAANGDDPSNAAVAYGIANYYYYNGDKEKSDQMLRSILQGSSWASFGYIAAEADIANLSR
ncbi:MAG: tetratricopeptide (TPR) repeat protein [Pseudohongiellaceae bacterium]|jgi:tetratricopeptide (TPR) repeat protein